ncbi:MAG: DUF3644 domain-containing protein [Rhodobacteraceae bacterium]|nr:DUF3644 domain-containing protein [Paracoccaceae bacterium]
MIRRPEGALTDYEKEVVKRLLLDGKRNQDIQALVNLGRSATINSARITEVKQNGNIQAASEAEVRFFKAKKESLDLRTGLNLYDDERLVRSREAMLLAVHVFNSANLQFKTEVFSVLANIAWTYLLHEYYEKQGVEIVGEDGRSLLLSQMTRRADCPISQGMTDNLDSMKDIRDAVEHTLFRRSDLKFLSIFQACCLNFDKAICDLFGKSKTLKHELSFSLQFAQMGFDQLNALHEYDIPEHIQTLDRELDDRLEDERATSLEYRFRVVYTFENSTKSKSHIRFLHPDEEEASEIRNVLIKKELADKAYPHKPERAALKISEQSGLVFTTHNHVQAWKKFDVRPKAGVAQPQNTNRDYCIYHEAHSDYTYSDKWVEFIVNFISNEGNFAELKTFR